MLHMKSESLTKSCSVNVVQCTVNFFKYLSESTRYCVSVGRASLLGGQSLNIRNSRVDRVGNGTYVRGESRLSSAVIGSSGVRIDAGGGTVDTTGIGGDLVEKRVENAGSCRSLAVFYSGSREDAKGATKECQGGEELHFDCTVRD